MLTLTPSPKFSQGSICTCRHRDCSFKKGCGKTAVQSLYTKGGWDSAFQRAHVGLSLLNIFFSKGLWWAYAGSGLIVGPGRPFVPRAYVGVCWAQIGLMRAACLFLILQFAEISILERRREPMICYLKLHNRSLGSISSFAPSCLHETPQFGQIGI